MTELNLKIPIAELATAIAEKLAPLFETKSKDEHLQPQLQSYLTRKETAKLLNVSLPTLNEYSKSGKIKAYRVGVRVLYKQSEIESSLVQFYQGRALHA